MKSWQEPTKGVVYAVISGLLWGFIPLYYLFVYDIPPLELLAHRVLWTVVAISIALILARRTHALVAILKQPKILSYLAITSILIGGNWLVFTWAVLREHVIDASMGYFINPLFNVVLGIVFLGERLRAAQLIAVGLAACGIIWLVFSTGELPWVALALPFFFGIYGLLRKQIEVDSLTGLFVEAAYLTPMSLGYIAYISANSLGNFGSEASVSLLLMLSGPITLTPLVFFAAGVRRISYSTMGFLQYLAPSIGLLLGIFVFKEEFGPKQLVTYALIWTALAIYTVESVIHARRQIPAAP